MNCYKNWIYDICSMDGVWEGRDATLFEKCERSDIDNSDLIAKFTTWDLLEAKADQIWYGSVDPGSSVHCKCLPGLSKGCSSAASQRLDNWDPVEKMAYNFYSGVGAYFKENYPQGVDLSWLPQHIDTE